MFYFLGRREKMSYGYQRRVANFVREMVAEPVITYDEYSDA